MPKVRPLTRQERETQAIENETKRICTEVLTAVREKRGLEEKTYAQVAEEIGISVDRLNRWRNGELPSAGFGRGITACTKMGYRLVLEPIGKTK